MLVQIGVALTALRDCSGGFGVSKLTVGFLLVFLGVIGSPALGQSVSDVTSTLIVSRIVVQPDGKEASEPAKTAKPADVLEYIAEYRNSGSRAATRLEATLPIPSGTEYVPDSAKPATAMASLDGVTFDVIPLKRKVKQPDGKIAEQLVPYAEYRFLRWPPRDLATGNSVTYTARAKVFADAPVNSESKN